MEQIDDSHNAYQGRNWDLVYYSDSVNGYVRLYSTDNIAGTLISLPIETASIKQEPEPIKLGPEQENNLYYTYWMLSIGALIIYFLRKAVIKEVRSQTDITILFIAIGIVWAFYYYYINFYGIAHNWILKAIELFNSGF